MKLCVIPARGGSKRIPGKNIRPFCGQPIIAYSIETALQTGLFDRVIVSTDDDEIAEVANQYGAEIPFLRPAHLSDDYTGTNAVVRHAIDWMHEKGETVEASCCIYATSPFVLAEDIQKGFENMMESDSDYAFSVTSFAFPIQRSIRITEKDRVEMFWPEYLNTRSQDLEEAYHDAGQFYWGRAEAIMSNVNVFSAASVPVVLPRYRVQDIDTIEDWKRAEVMFKVLEKS